MILTITVLDANDNPPDFLPSKIYRVNVSEGVPLDTEVLTVKATDKDKNQKIWFRIGYDPMATFKIKSSESYTGKIFFNYFFHFIVFFFFKNQTQKLYKKV